MLDILQPSAPSLADRPGVIFIHGGGWVEGDKEDKIRNILPAVRAARHGGGEHRVSAGESAPAPAAVNDVLKAAQWFQDHAAMYRVDRKRFRVSGKSAGGHLALMTAMTPASAGLGPSIKIAAVVDFYGIADVADRLAGPSTALRRRLGSPQPDRMELARRVSPITYVRKGLPPILFCMATWMPSCRTSKAWRW